ncbi:hypothetical protein [uncultured Mediterranean phage uvMED]|nr:hypothetical protein [uncultured Mediterranean phage uvMED]
MEVLRAVILEILKRHDPKIVTDVICTCYNILYGLFNRILTRLFFKRNSTTY